MTSINKPKALSVLLFIIFSIHCTTAQERTTEFENGLHTISEHSLQAQTEFMASDWFTGRETATKGAYMAADYIASQFKLFGTHPYYDEYGNQGYFQNVKLISTSLNTASLKVSQINKTNKVSATFHNNTDFTTAGVLRDLLIEGDIFWGGYGLNQKPFHQLEGASKGLILLRMSGFPGMNDSTSPGWQAYGNMTPQQLNAQKNEAARQAGFVAILEFSPDISTPVSMPHPNADRTYSEYELHKYTSGIYRKSIRLVPSEREDPVPVFQISHDILNMLLSHWKNEISKIEQNPSRWKGTILNNITLEIESSTDRSLIECRNVLAVIEGETPDEVIVIGAHYDHLGEYDGYIWNGADDNASGTVGVIALARAFAKSGLKPKKTLVFAAWTAEERGLHGSKHFVNTHPELAAIKYYLNYDMIGREANPENPNMNATFIYTESNERMAQLTREANEHLNLGLNIRYAPSALPASGSDNAPFALNGIPIMWYFTGMHSDYHGPFDHANKINYEKMAAIIKASYKVLWQLANED